MDQNIEDYRETIDIDERQFQKISVERHIYPIPVDEDEEERQVSQHLLFQELFDDKLFFPPISFPRKVLECGYGRGSWAVSMAQTYEDCEVTALDIYPADLPDEPENLFCEVWDLNQTLLPSFSPSYYNLIHSRCVAPGIELNRWPSYVRDLKRLLRPNGWVQLVEYYYIIQSDSGLLTSDHSLQEWSDGYRAALESIRDPRAGRNLSQMLRTAGFDGVEERTFRVPIGSWPTDPVQRRIGSMNLQNIREMIYSHGVHQFTKKYGWSLEQFRMLARKAQDDLTDNRLKLYIPLTVSWGMKR